MKFIKLVVNDSVEFEFEGSKFQDLKLLDYLAGKPFDSSVSIDRFVDGAFYSVLRDFARLYVAYNNRKYDLLDERFDALKDGLDYLKWGITTSDLLDNDR